jgi:asparagine synthase (glutamine-hydrolysing)
MCGIAGWFGKSAGLEVGELQQSLRHRGPDGSGVWMDAAGQAALVHTRLAILDLTDAGAQPMIYSGEDAVSRLGSGIESAVAAKGSACAVLVFNGEIYNFRELREAMESAGEAESFVGHSDTEVLLRLLLREGRAALPKLAGMFAFAFWDATSGRALLARDAFGIKPLYFSTRDGGLQFASEVKALRRESACTVDAPAMRDFLLWGSMPESTTLWHEIRQLPAGGFMEWEWDGSSENAADANTTANKTAEGGPMLKLGQWFKPTFIHRSAPSDPVGVTRAALVESIERHLVSDVPVGIFLSGGIDSTAVLALARQTLGATADLRTFSIGFHSPEYDESSVARRTAERFGANHTEWMMTAEDGVAEIPHYLAAMDQPGIDGFNTWCVSKLARREGMKVVLSGLGGDELFSGYDSFRQVPRFRRAYRLAGPLRKLLPPLLNRTAAGSRWRRLAAFLAGSGSALAAFHAQRGIFTESEARELTLALAGVDPGPANWEVDGLPNDPLDEVSFLELTRYMRNQLLRDSDVYSMAHGLELRVPFVDLKLFEAIAGIPSAVRLRQGKKLLLEAVPEIPSEVANAPKRGFRFPFQDWLATSFGAQFQAAAENLPVATPQWYKKWCLFVLRGAIDGH